MTSASADKPRPRLLLVPSFTELEWGIGSELEKWADVASFDVPGVGEEPLPEQVDLTPDTPEQERATMLRRWREATAERGLREVDERGWERFFVVCDSYGTPSAVRLAAIRSEAVQGLAIGHASLSHSFEGKRPPANRAVWEAMASLMRTDREAFIRYGIAQMTRGGIAEEVAGQMVARFPDTDLVVAFWETLATQSEPIGEVLERIGTPLLLAKHEGCLGRTDEGFEDIVEAFPEARTVACPEACSSSPAFAEALRGFCADISGD